MVTKLRAINYHNLFLKPSSSSSLNPISSTIPLPYFQNQLIAYTEDNDTLRLEVGLSFGGRRCERRREIEPRSRIIAASSNVAEPLGWEDWKPEKGSKTPSLSDVVWPAAGAFAAMAILGKMDQILAPRGISMTVAPFGAVCAVLFAAPSSPSARKYNMFIAQIGCAALGVLAFSIFGPGWLARSTGLAAAIAFMIYTRAIHPPAASLPLLFVDGAKLHGLKFWYAFFPGAAGCILLCLIVSFLASLAVIYFI